MDGRTVLISVALAGVIVLGVGGAASAQGVGTVEDLMAPDYGSGAAAGPMSNQNFNTPESDGRPGVKFFTYGVRAFRKGDYQHAIDMYKVAASWAYKPAEYNLAVMYFKGHGVPLDRARGAAWMVLAAERGDSQYTKARDLMVTVLSRSEFVRTDELWGELKQTYGDEVALRRAKAQWAFVRTHKTGTRVGGEADELVVGVLDGGHSPKPLGASGQPLHVATTAAEILQSGSIDGSVAYRQFRQSDNPYNPAFIKDRGTATVEPLLQIKPGADKHASGKKAAKTHSSHSTDTPRNA